MMHIPPLLGFVAIIAEFRGGLGLIIGLLGHVAGLGILVNMIVAVAMVHSRVGFFMNWTGQQKGEGFEYHLLATALLLLLMIRGSGVIRLIRFLRTPSALGKRKPRRRHRRTDQRKFAIQEAPAVNKASPPRADRPCPRYQLLDEAGLAAVGRKFRRHRSVLRWG